MFGLLALREKSFSFNKMKRPGGDWIKCEWQQNTTVRYHVDKDVIQKVKLNSRKHILNRVWGLFILLHLNFKYSCIVEMRKCHLFGFPDVYIEIKSP